MSKRISLRPLLIQELREHCVPLYLQNGFKLCPSRSVEIGGEPERHYPLGTLERKNVDGSIDMVEFEFNLRGEPSFKFCFAQIAKEGGYSDYSFHKQKDSVPSGIGKSGYCKPNRFLHNRW